jgi:hypothetical protein
MLFPFCCSPFSLEITPAQLLLLTNSRLKALGVSEAGNRYRILYFVKTLKNAAAFIAAHEVTPKDVFDTDVIPDDDDTFNEKSEIVGLEISCPVVRGNGASIESKKTASKCIKRMLHRDFWRVDGELCIFAPSYPNVFPFLTHLQVDAIVLGEDGTRRRDFLKSWDSTRNDGVFSMERIEDIPTQVNSKKAVEIVGDPKRRHMIPGVYHSEIIEEDDELLPLWTGESDIDRDSELHDEDSSGEEEVEEDLEGVMEEVEEELDPMVVDSPEKIAPIEKEKYETPMQDDFSQSQLLLDELVDFPQSQNLLDELTDDSEAKVASSRETRNETVNLDKAREIVREYIAEHKVNWLDSYHVVEFLLSQHYQIYHGNNLEQVGKDLSHLQNKLDGLVETILLGGSKVSSLCSGLDEVRFL